MNRPLRILVLVAAAAASLAPPSATGLPAAPGIDARAATDLDDASGGQVALVLATSAPGCLVQQFVPEVVRVQNGDLVRWRFVNPCGFVAAHTATSSGSSGTVEADLGRPDPTPLKATCFDSGILNVGRPEFTVDLDFAGVVVRDLGATPPVPCVGSNSVDPAGPAGVVPYHCRIHGPVGVPPHVAMRGAIVVSL